MAIRPTSLQTLEPNCYPSRSCQESQESTTIDRSQTASISILSDDNDVSRVELGRVTEVSQALNLSFRHGQL